jgi:pyrimidine-nucleoside phosphorylase
MHAVDLIRKTRDGEPLWAEEIQFLVAGAASGSLPQEQLAAWLMAVFQRGLTPGELSALTEAMRFSGETFDAREPGKRTVDKHSTGGVGDKTSLLVAPIVAAAGLLDPMISGRALGHTGGTLDKLESIPGFRTGLSLAEMRVVLEKTGACLVGQTAELVPADRTLYALRDRTATVESPYLICASIMSKKLAAGLDALVLDVKTGSGAFLRDREQARFLAKLMVETGERAGTRTAALLTDMSQPLGSSAGNWIEVAECCALFKGERPALSEDLRSLSLSLAGWMLFLGGAETSAKAGQARAEMLLESGAAWEKFRAIAAAQGGDLRALDKGMAHHAPGAQTVFKAQQSGFLTRMDTTAIGWAVQRLGAGRAAAGAAVDPHAGLTMHRKLGDAVSAGETICTLYAAHASLFSEPLTMLAGAITIAEEREKPPPLIGEVVTRETLTGSH